MFQEPFFQIGNLLLNGLRVQAVDVGGAHGLIPHWQKFLGNTDFYVYEPHEESYIQLIKMYEDSRFNRDFHIIKTALSGTGGMRKFYATNAPTGSSLLKPNISDERYANDSYFVPVKEILIRTQRLSDSLSDESVENIDAIKLDAQGGELEILEGLDKERLNNLLLVETEVGLADCYENSPTMGQMQSFLKDASLELYDIRTQRDVRRLKDSTKTYNEEIFGVGPKSSSIAARLNEVDMVFFKTPESIAKTGSVEMLKKMVYCLCVYNYFSEAYFLLTEGPTREMFSQEDKTKTLELIKVWQNLNAQLMTPYDNVLQATDFQIWGHYAWSSYPCA